MGVLQDGLLLRVRGVEVVVVVVVAAEKCGAPNVTH
jgi:hypothetical protein